MQRNGASTARKDAAPKPTPADDAGGTLPAELRFLAAQATDPQERERIVRAYYAFAHGTPESASVQFALLASALLRANLAAAQDVAEHAAKVTAAARIATGAANARAGARPAASAEESSDAVREALRPLAEGLNVLNREITGGAQQRLTGAALLLAGLLMGVLLGYALGRF